MEFLALPAVAAPCLFLALNRGGTGTLSQALSYAWIFLALAVWAVVQFRAGIAIRFSWLALFLLAWPLLQLAPLPAGLAARLAPQRSAELAEFAAAGVSAARTTSLYPYATIRTFLILAGSVGLFLLTRDLCRRAPAALDWLAAAVLVLGLAEALPALRQYLLIQTGAAPGFGPEIRGTFGNRNLLAAWLEGCYGLALGMFAVTLGRRPGQTHWRGALLMGLLAGLAALASAVVVVCSLSRMGLVGIALETLLLPCLNCHGARRRLLASAAFALVVVLCAVALGIPGLGRRYTTAYLAQEKEGRLAMWTDSIHAARRYPILGAGAGAFTFAFRRSHPYYTAYTIDHPHNEYLEMAVEWGIPAAFLLAAGMVISLFRRLRELGRASGHRRGIGLGCLVGACAVFLHAAVDFPLRIPAILALVAVLLGMAAALGASCGRAPLPCRISARLVTGLLVFVGAGLAAFSLWSCPPDDGSPSRLERWNAEAHYRAAQTALDSSGEVGIEEAQTAYLRTLHANPYAAVVWNELALVAEARGDRTAALGSSDLAQKLEPHTRRIQWEAANLRLRLGDVPGAALLFAALVTHTPELRRAVWEICWNAGLPGNRIFDDLVGKFPKDLEDYLYYLLDRKRWKAALEAIGQATAAGRQAPSPERLRAVFERLFEAGEFEPTLRLWSLVGSKDARLREQGFSNGNFADPWRGYGLDWVVWPVEGVLVERRKDQGDFQLDIVFQRHQNITYGGVVHDFAVTPGRPYQLRFEVAAQEIGSSSGVEVEVISLRRRLAVSEPLRRTSGWRTVELRFHPREDERICRMRVLRRASSSFDNQISGRFSLRRVSLTPPD